MSQLHEFLAGPEQTRYVSEQARFKQKAQRFMQDYPDVHGLAWAAARQVIKQHTGKVLDPDRVWWHRFATASSSPLTFTGWQHSGAPVESMTLVELVMRRFNAQDQDGPDDLQVYGGFYTDGPQHRGAFDEHNEVALLPGQVLQQLWALDFASDFRRRVDAFWVRHGATFCELARARFLSAAALAVRRGQLSVVDGRALVRAVAREPALSPGNHTHSLALPVQGEVSVRSFDIGGHEASQIIRMVDVRGRQILYLPGQDPAFQVCETERDLYEWVQHCISQPALRRHFETLFLSSPQAWQDHAEAFGALLDQIGQQPLDADHNRVEAVALRLLNTHERVIVGDVFEHLREQARHQMQAVADALTSNASLRKQMWIGYLNAFMRVFGPSAVVAWPLALTLVGAGLANVGLNIDLAINGSTARQRKAGVIGAILNSIFVLFNLPLLVDALPALRASASAAAGALSGPDVAGPEWIALQNLNREAQLAGQAPMQGITRSETGETWIRLGNTPQRVRYSQALNTWLIVDPLNPFAFEGARAVRLNAHDEWEALPALQLSGGSPMNEAGPSALAGSPPEAPVYPTIRSTFWDTYMQFNADEEDRLSDLALARQKAVVSVHQLAAEDELSVDSEGDQVLRDAWGDEYRVFKVDHDHYVGGRVTRYSEREEEFNQFLRTGKAGITNQVEMIEELADDLQAIGYDNHATLYRGGSGARGTSGMTFRAGVIKAGDVLVNTDFASFSENPYVARSFASSQAGAPSYGFSGPISFDETSIVFEMLAEQYLGATPIALFSREEEEAESLFAPGHYFEVQDIREVAGTHYKFIRVRIKEVPLPPAGSKVYEMRTGEPFSREQYAARLGAEGQKLVERFFPLPSTAVQGSSPLPAS
ncbi:dermonecrotic toxin domain-containing protein [Pseudomonas ovata]|uniref:dermonecrotic toxin domain-containing protein n=1 Tax=Pseudomonas ovata TaxID=1839709 RepID=UPI000D69BA28|nr:DUF6543 domain-containing protein [Pseudomonas ovata]